MKRWQELIAKARQLLEDAGDNVTDEVLAKVEGLKRKAEQLKALDSFDEPATEAEQDTGDDDEVMTAVLDEIKALKAQLNGEPASKGSGYLVVTEDETDKKAKQPFATAGEQLKAIAQAYLQPHRMDERLKAQKAILGQNESQGSDGGFLVQQDFANEVWRIMHDTDTIATLCRDWPISSNANGTKIPAVDETSRAAGSRWGGVLGYWVAEGGTITASQMKFRQIELDLKKMAALVYATDEILNDSTQLTTLMTTAVPEELNFMLGDSIINGDGAGKPLGVLNSPALVSIAKETGQAAATIQYENIIKMWSRMPARNRMSAIWIHNQDIEPQLLSVDFPVGTGGVPVFLPPGGLSSSPYGTLMGRPLVPTEYNATLGTVGDIMLVDLSQYLLARKANSGVQQAQSIHVQFLTDQTAFRFIMRVDGQPAWYSALTPAKGSATKSPFVALATRA